MGAARLEPRGGQKEQSDRKGQGQTLSNIEWSGAASVFFSVWHKTAGHDFDDLMFVFLILLLTSARLQCDNKTFGDDFDDLMFVFLI